MDQVCRYDRGLLIMVRNKSVLKAAIEVVRAIFPFVEIQVKKSEFYFFRRKNDVCGEAMGVRA